MKNVIAIGVASVLGCVTGTALAQVIDDGGPGPVGDSTGFSPNYFEVQTKFGDLYNGHGIGNNNTQYFQTINGKTTYVRNEGDLAGVAVDTSPYKALERRWPQGFVW
jgi:hypothetical protein